MPVDLSQLKRGAFESPGETSTAERQAAAAGGVTTEPLASYLRKVREAAYKVTDEDVAALLAAGLSEDAIYELTVAAAVGQGLLRFEAGMQALRAPKGGG
jgi:hypothetical protein